MSRICLMRREVHVGECIPDVLYTHFSEKPDPSIWPARWTGRHAHIVHHLRHAWALSVDEIACLCYSPSPFLISEAIDELLVTGAVYRVGDSRFALSSRILAPRTTITAVEAKLSRWRQALRQCEHYKRFADIAVVAMDAAKTPRSREVLATFRHRGIGLCAVEADDFDWLVMPRMAAVSCPQKEYVLASSSSPQSDWVLRKSFSAFSQHIT